jgi:hypothetical protein
MRLERLEERSGAAVHDRRLGPVQRDHEIVELQRLHRGEDMLHRVHGVRLLAELRAALGEHRVLRQRGNRPGASQIASLKHDTAAGRRRQEFQGALHSQMQSGAAHRADRRHRAPHD